MNDCLSQMVTCATYALEQLGLYEPEITIQEARYRLNKEAEIWQKSQRERDQLWKNFQINNETNGDLLPLVEKAIIHLDRRRHRNTVAVDLGCGISNTTFNLLERGWKVYAVDNSKPIIDELTDKVARMGKKWIEEGHLVLVNQSIEDFEYPEKVDLIIAIDSFGYCNPEQIGNIFLKAKNALNAQGVVVCTFFSYSKDHFAKNLFREIFGAWMTTKNVVEAVMKSVDFPSYSVIEGQSPAGFAKQFHVFAENKRAIQEDISTVVNEIQSTI